jgi:hypothetical protein
LVRAADDGEIRISVEVFVERHRLVHLTAGRALMVLLQELQDDQVPVHHVRVVLSGQLPGTGCR